MKEYRDHYFLKAKKENYPARSVYKLKEIDLRFKVLKKGMRILDLGACPGSWTMAACEKIGETGFVLACDIKPMEISLPPQAFFICTDVFKPSEEFKRALSSNGQFDLVMSDMAPATTGNKFTDQCRSYELAGQALSLAVSSLCNGGVFIVKIFMGPDVNAYIKQMHIFFKYVKNYKPKSSRAESKELFIIGMDYKKTDFGENYVGS